VRKDQGNPPGTATRTATGAAPSPGRCRRCGTCCHSGGPALHRQDLHLLGEGPLRRHHLITIRRGEPVQDPGQNAVRLLESEIVKLAGSGSEWACRFFGADTASCGIYQQRPLECELLKCWDTGDLTGVIGRDNLERKDIIDPEDPVMEVIRRHERECSCHEACILALAILAPPSAGGEMDRLAELVNRDLAMRLEACERLDLSPALEMFLFGRPIFKILAGFGFTAREKGGRIILTVPQFHVPSSSMP